MINESQIYRKNGTFSDSNQTFYKIILFSSINHVHCHHTAADVCLTCSDDVITCHFITRCNFEDCTQDCKSHPSYISDSLFTDY